jgi:hypothetical protein
MRNGVMHRYRRLGLHVTSIRHRLFWLLAGMSLGLLLVVSLAWLPAALRDIQEAQAEFQHAVVRGVIGQVQLFLEDKEEALGNQAKQFRIAYLEGDRESLRQLALRFFQRERDFIEIGILDSEGQERLRISRFLTVTNGDLGDRSASELFREGMRQEIFWGPVVTSATSEPRVALAIPLQGSNAARVGAVYGVINLRSLWNVTGDLRLDRGGRPYVVDHRGQLIAADDPNLVLKQLSFADRPLVQQLMQGQRSDSLPVVQGRYTNEHHVRVVATGLPLPRTGWGWWLSSHNPSFMPLFSTNSGLPSSSPPWGYWPASVSPTPSAGVSPDLSSGSVRR